MNKTVEKLAAGVEFDSERAFGEIYLHFMRAFLQTAAHFRFVFAQ